MHKSLISKTRAAGRCQFSFIYGGSCVCTACFIPGTTEWHAVSDLSAANAPSLVLWNQLSALYNVCEVVCHLVLTK